MRARYGELTGETIVHVVPGVAGIWRGSITVIDCWQAVRTDPDPCEGQRGVVAPLLLTVTQSASADLYDNLRATGTIFRPPATGSFVGAHDSSGLFFLDGHVERNADGLAGAVNFRWQLDGDRLVPSTLHPLGDDKIDVSLSVRAGSQATTFQQLWQIIRPHTLRFPLQALTTYPREGRRHGDQCKGGKSHCIAGRFPSTGV